MRSPFQHERLLSGIEAWHQGFEEIAIVGSPDDPGTKELLRAVHQHVPSQQDRGEAWTPEILKHLSEYRCSQTARKSTANPQPTSVAISLVGSRRRTQGS